MNLLFFGLPLWYFLAALPTVVLEGEAYVLAAAAGLTVGLSWFKPKEGLSRRTAFNDALRQSLHAYVIVALILFVSAIVESATLILT